jgi:hypothetical protein
MKTGALLVAFAAANAVLYSALLPLWEGFDEPFHFAYVDRLAAGGGFPDARTDGLSREVAESLAVAPASVAVKANLPRVTTYAEFFRWTPERRAQAGERLREIPAPYRREPSDIGNYEAYQAPLAYLLLALPDRMMGAASLTSRVLVLRMVAGLAGALLLLSGGLALCRELGLGEPWRSIAIFCALAAQMTWATLAHVDNDWLAAPLAVWLLALLIRADAKPGAARIAIASLALAAGLLAKAYFLALAPVVLAIAALRRGWRGFIVSAGIVAVCAGPWYARNMLVYGDLTGMPQSRGGTGAGAVLRAAPGIDWPKMILDSARMALWTGNNTGRTFSMATLDVTLAVAAVGLALWGLRRRARGELVAAAYCAAFMAAIAYAGVQTTVASHGAARAPSPWYAQTILTPLLVLCLLGASRWKRAGVLPAALLPLLFGYELAATYLFKLIPLYAGYEGRGTARQIASLYGRNFGRMCANLASAALGPVWLIFGLAGLVIALVLVLDAMLARELWKETLRA